MKSRIHFRGRGGVNLPWRRSARRTIGDPPRVAPRKRRDKGERPLLAGFFPETRGVLDDHVEGWFLTYDEPPRTAPEGLESVVGLGLSQDWLPAPGAAERPEDTPSPSPTSAA